jgi:oligo-1,6-glucosidase
VFHHYRRLIELRQTEPAVAHGDFTMLLEDDPVVYAFTRRLGDTELLVVANFSAESTRPDLPDYGSWVREAELLLGNVPDGSTVELAPWEARVHRRSVGA